MNNLNISELLVYYNSIKPSKKKAILKSYTKFNQNPLIIQQVLHGSMLGDGSAQRIGPNRNARLGYTFGTVNLEYAEWLHRLFVTLGYCNLKPLKATKHFHASSQTWYEHVTFNTFAFVSLTELHSMYYRPATLEEITRQSKSGNNFLFTKRIPLNIADLLTSDLTLAVWIMDDGFFDIYDGRIKLATHSFTKDEIELLINALKLNFNLEFQSHQARISKHTGNIHYNLVLSKKQVPDFVARVKPHMLPCMWYKIGLNEDGSLIITKKAKG